MVPQTGSGQEKVVQQARSFLEQKQPAEAARLLRTYLTTHPETGTVQMLLGVALLESGEGLLALQALERAVEIEPENAVAYYNLGLAYREFGRLGLAITALERSLQLRPDHPAVARTLAQLRGRAASAPRASTSPSGAPLTQAPEISAPLMIEPGEIDDHPMISRMLEAAWQLVWSPVRALNGGMDTFFNTPGAVGAVIGFFLLTTVLVTTVALVASPHGEGGGVLWILSSIVSVIATAGTIATFNRLTGGIDDFAADFGSLALSFALIEATLSLAALPILLVAGLAGAAGFVAGLLLSVSLWKYCLELGLVMVTTDINLFTGIVLLGVAHVVASIATGMVLGALLGAVVGASL